MRYNKEIIICDAFSASKISRLLYALAIFGSYCLQMYPAIKTIWDEYLLKHIKEDKFTLYDLLLRYGFLLFTCTLTITHIDRCMLRINRFRYSGNVRALAGPNNITSGKLLLVCSRFHISTNHGLLSKVSEQIRLLQMDRRKEYNFCHHRNTLLAYRNLFHNARNHKPNKT